MNGHSIAIGIALLVLSVVLGLIGRDYWHTYTARKLIEREIMRAQHKEEYKAILRESRNAEE